MHFIVIIFKLCIDIYCIFIAVLRTWTQEMIDNMLKTRKLALTKRKEQGKSDMHNLTGNYI